MMFWTNAALLPVLNRTICTLSQEPYFCLCQAISRSYFSTRDEIGAIHSSALWDAPMQICGLACLPLPSSPRLSDKEM